MKKEVTVVSHIPGQGICVGKGFLLAVNKMDGSDII